MKASTIDTKLHYFLSSFYSIHKKIRQKKSIYINSKSKMLSKVIFLTSSKHEFKKYWSQNLSNSHSIFNY